MVLVPTSRLLFPPQLLHHDIHCLEKSRHSWLFLQGCHWRLPYPLIVHHWWYLVSYLLIKHSHIQMCLISSQRDDWWKASHKPRSRPWHGRGVVCSTDDVLSTLSKLSGCSSWHLWCIESAEVQDGSGGSGNYSLKDIDRECTFCLRVKTEVLAERSHSAEGDAQLSAYLNRTSCSREESSITRVEINQSETNTTKASRFHSIFIQMIKHCIKYSKNHQNILPRL